MTLHSPTHSRLIPDKETGTADGVSVKAGYVNKIIRPGVYLIEVEDGKNFPGCEDTLEVTWSGSGELAPY